jgi:hypothetical protein
MMAAAAAVPRRWLPHAAWLRSTTLYHQSVGCSTAVAATTAAVLVVGAPAAAVAAALQVELPAPLLARVSCQGISQARNNGGSSVTMAPAHTTTLDSQAAYQHWRNKQLAAGRTAFVRWIHSPE